MLRKLGRRGTACGTLGASGERGPQLLSVRIQGSLLNKGTFPHWAIELTVITSPPRPAPAPGKRLHLWAGAHSPTGLFHGTLCHRAQRRPSRSEERRLPHPEDCSRLTERPALCDQLCSLQGGAAHTGGASSTATPWAPGAGEACQGHLLSLPPGTQVLLSPGSRASSSPNTSSSSSG